MRPTGWPPSPATVHLWELDLAGPRRSQSPQSLSSDEARRAAGFLRARDRDLFVATRTVLRTLLGSYLGCDPSAVHIVPDALGKPTVVHERCAVHVNVSHTDGRSLIAVAGRPVGVDIERSDRQIDVERAGQLVLTAAERADLARLDDDAARLAFFVYWTRKEAISKGVGLGFALGFHTLEARADQPTTVFDWPAGDHGRHGTRETWWCEDLAVDPPYVAAVAVGGARPRIRRRAWRWDRAPGCPGALGRRHERHAAATSVANPGVNAC
jgi:4'-phosphopantetheinyl transferase